MAAAGPHRGGCWIATQTTRPSTHRIYLAPDGCVWLLRPDDGFYSIGPEFRTRRAGHTDGFALLRDPIGAAEAVCGFTSIVVAWPDFVVTAQRVAWGDGTGCHDLPGAQAVFWAGHFVEVPREGRRPARYDAVLDASSPPLVH